MNIIFLDIDGVLATGSARKEAYLRTGKPHSGSNSAFDPECMGNLLYIVKKTNAKIIISSTWRKNEAELTALFDKFRAWGLYEYVIDFTPILNTERGEEIKECLKKYPNANYVIIDDNSDMGELKDHLVKVDFDTGLTKELSEEVIKRLTR